MSKLVGLKLKKDISFDYQDQHHEFPKGRINVFEDLAEYILQEFPKVAEQVEENE